MERDLYSDCKVLIALKTQTINTDTVTDGETIDTLGFESLVYALASGTITASGAPVVILEESDTGAFGGEESVVPAANILNPTLAFADGDDDHVWRIGVNAKKRYQRLTIDSDATTNGVFFAIAVLGHPKHAPVASQET